jgi:hypothetical protein
MLSHIYVLSEKLLKVKKGLKTMLFYIKINTFKYGYRMDTLPHWDIKIRGR